MVYDVENSEQFWKQLQDIASGTFHSLSKVNDGLSTYIEFAVNYLNTFLDKDEDLAKCGYHLINSSIFSKNKAYVRRRLISQLMNSNIQPSLCLFIGVILLLDGKHNPATLEMMQEESAISTLINTVWKTEIQYIRLHRVFLELLYEMCHIQKLTLPDLSLVKTDFICYLFTAVENKEDYDYDPYSFAVIKVLLALNEQFMVAAYNKPSNPSIVKLSDIHRSNTPDERGKTCSIQKGNTLAPDDDENHNNNDPPFRKTKSAFSLHDLEVNLKHEQQDYSATTLENKVFTTLTLHKDQYRTFGENIVFLLNRCPNNTLQLMVLKLLYLIFTTPATYEYLYLNDLKVIVDVFIRELYNLSCDEENLIHTYLRVLHPLLLHTELRAEEYKKRELVSLLEYMSDNASKSCVLISETTQRLAYRCLFVDWLGVPAVAGPRKCRTFDETMSSYRNEDKNGASLNNNNCSDSENIKSSKLASDQNSNSDDSIIVGDRKLNKASSFSPTTTTVAETLLKRHEGLSHLHTSNSAPACLTETDPIPYHINTERAPTPSITQSSQSSRSSRSYDQFQEADDSMTPTSPVSTISSGSESMNYEKEDSGSTNTLLSLHEVVSSPTFSEDKVTPGQAVLPPPPPPSRTIIRSLQGKHRLGFGHRSKPPPPPPPPSASASPASSIIFKAASASTSSLALATSTNHSISPNTPVFQTQNHNLPPPPPPPVPHRRLSHAKSSDALRMMGSSRRPAHAPPPPPPQSQSQSQPQSQSQSLNSSSSQPPPVPPTHHRPPPNLVYGQHGLMHAKSVEALSIAKITDHSNRRPSSSASSRSSSSSSFSTSTPGQGLSLPQPPPPPPSRLMRKPPSLQNLGMSIRNTSALELAAAYVTEKPKDLPPLPDIHDFEDEEQQHSQHSQQQLQQEDYDCTNFPKPEFRERYNDESIENKNKYKSQDEDYNDNDDDEDEDEEDEDNNENELLPLPPAISPTSSHSMSTGNHRSKRGAVPPIPPAPRLNSVVEHMPLSLSPDKDTPPERPRSRSVSGGYIHPNNTGSQDESHQHIPPCPPIPRMYLSSSHREKETITVTATRVSSSPIPPPPPPPHFSHGIQVNHTSEALDHRNDRRRNQYYSTPSTPTPTPPPPPPPPHHYRPGSAHSQASAI